MAQEPHDQKPARINTTRHNVDEIERGAQRSPGNPRQSDTTKGHNSRARFSRKEFEMGIGLCEANLQIQLLDLGQPRVHGPKKTAVQVATRQLQVLSSKPKTSALKSRRLRHRALVT